MALSAVVTLNKSTASVQAPVQATVTFTNTGGSAVTVTSCNPSVITTGFATDPAPASIGVVAQGPGINLSVPGSSGTLALNFTFNAISVPSQSGTYTVGALCSTSDGSVFAATTATFTPIAISLPDSN